MKTGWVRNNLDSRSQLHSAVVAGVRLLDEGFLESCGGEQPTRNVTWISHLASVSPGSRTGR